jgi:hypothetical protein
MKIFLNIFAITLIIVSCNYSVKAKFEITNKTNRVVDSIGINSSGHKENSNFITLKPEETKTYWLDMTDLPKIDGDYLLTFKGSEKYYTVYKRFGYFTNGYPLEEKTKIKIYNDTLIIFDQIFNKY